jgi:hypothetical protein
VTVLTAPLANLLLIERDLGSYYGKRFSALCPTSPSVGVDAAAISYFWNRITIESKNFIHLTLL